MDDFPSAALSGIQQQLHGQFMLENLHSLGWVVKEPKLIVFPNPLPEIPALGTIISFTEQKFFMKPAHIQEILSIAKTLHDLRDCHVRLLSKLAGLIISRSHCLGPAARMRTRAMYRNIEARLQPHEKTPPWNARHKGWHRHVHIHKDTKAELAFWLSNINRVNGQPFKRDSLERVLDIDLNTDASHHGWGAVLYLPDSALGPDPHLLEDARQALPPNMTIHAVQSALSQGIKVCGKFSIAEALDSSNARELLATFYSLRTLIIFLQDLRLDHHMDNLGAVQALGGIIPGQPHRIFGGSNTPRIQDLVIQIDDCCINANIDRHTSWVPRNLNTIADYMSKTGLGDEHSFMVQPWVQQLLQAQFGPHTIDRFASRNNVQVVPPRYNSRFFEPEAEWLNSFSCHWDRGPNQIRENNWIHPPYAIMGRTLRHLITCGAQGTIILPHWEVAPWWPIIAELLPSHQCIALGQASNVLCFPPDSRFTLEHLPRGTILAIRFS